MVVVVDEQEYRNKAHEEFGMVGLDKVDEKNESHGREEDGGSIECDRDGMLPDGIRELERLPFRLSLDV